MNTRMRQLKILRITLLVLLVLITIVVLILTRKTKNEKQIIWFDQFTWPVTEYPISSDEENQGLIPVQSGDLYGFLNHNGELTIPLTYYGAKPFSDGLAPVATTLSA